MGFWGVGEEGRAGRLTYFRCKPTGCSVRPVTSSERNCKLPTEGNEEVFEQKETKETKGEQGWGLGWMGFWVLGGTGARRYALPTPGWNRSGVLSDVRRK